MTRATLASRDGRKPSQGCIRFKLRHVVPMGAMSFSFVGAALLLAPIALLAQGQPLKLLISVEQPVLVSPSPARLTLHLHNAGQETVWLYHSIAAAAALADRPAFGTVAIQHPVEGPTLAVKLEAEDNHATSSGSGLENIGLSHPKLARLAPGDDYEEKAVIRLAPAGAESEGESANQSHPQWGKYLLTATYSAQYSNAAEIERVVGVRLWQGEVRSNSIGIELQPPAAGSSGSILGRASNASNTALNSVLVSLSDDKERLIDQTSTGMDGGYSFLHLPLGLYWLTARRKDFDEDTAVIRHVELTADEPTGTVNFLMVPPETYFPKQMLHKPVLLRVVNSRGEPLESTNLEITWSSGTVLDNVKGVTSADGLAFFELLPGRQYITLKHKGCPKDDEHVDVASGPGIDGSALVMECGKR